VKSILREYLHADEDGEDEDEVVTPAPEVVKVEETKVEETKAEETKAEETKAEETKVEETKAEETKVEETKAEETKVEETKVEETKVEETKVEETKVEEVKIIAAPAAAPAEAEVQSQAPMIYIDTKPSVTFSQEHVVFDSNTLDNNEIHDLPFTEAENRKDEDEEDEADEARDDFQIDSVKISDEVLEMDADEIIS
jgi:hypothetical protein